MPDESRPRIRCSDVRPEFVAMRPIIDLNGFFGELELDEVLNTVFDSKLVQAGLAKNCCSRDQNGLIGPFCACHG